MIVVCDTSPVNYLVLIDEIDLLPQLFTTVVLPAGVLAEGAGSRELAAYARIDRLLSQVGPHDCVLVIGSRPQPAGDPGDRGEPQFPLAGLVDSWLQLAHPPVAPFRGRRVA